jgi:hypothetical protein
MALRKRLNKKGGSNYANVSDNYNLLDNTIKQIKGGTNKRGGCKYASVSDNYNLLEDAIKQIKGGNRKGGCVSYADVNSSYMITDAKKGGNRTRKGGDLLSMGQNLFNQINSSVQSTPQQALAPQALAPQAVAPQAVAPQAVAPVKTGGNRRGGCGCSNSPRMRKGGAIELAPFAAAVALMAARYMTDIDVLEPIDSHKSSRKSPVKSQSKSRVKKTTKKIVSKTY